MSEGPTPTDVALDLQALVTFYSIDGVTTNPQLAAVIVGLARRCLALEREAAEGRWREASVLEMLAAVRRVVNGATEKGGDL